MKILISVSLSVLCLATTFAWAEDLPLKAGAATANITPPLGAMIVGGWSPLPADEVHDELHVRAIVLDDGRNKLVFAICDNVGIPRDVFDEAKRLVTRTLAIPASHQLMSSTHTHSAASAREGSSMVNGQELNDYQKFIAERIADAVRIAHKRLEPALIGWGSVDEPSELFNRRWYVVEENERRNPFGGIDQVRMNPGGSSTLIRPAGPTDPEVSFVSLKAIDGRPIAVLANYSLHYVGGVPARELSADYFAVFASRLAEQMAAPKQYPPFVAALSNGTSGDVNNINFRERGPNRKPYEKMEEVGTLIAQRVYVALQSIPYRDKITLDARSSELELTIRKPDAKLAAYMESVVKRPEGEKPYQSHEKTYAERLDGLAKSPDSVRVPLQAIRIGNLAIAAIPFEVFTEIGLEIKDRCPLKDCFTIELANGSYGYLPTPAQHALGGYETWMGTNKVQIDASEKIVVEMLNHMQQLSPAQ